MRTDGHYYISTTVASVLWSASFVATQFAYDTFTPIQLGAVRTALAALLFALLRLFMKPEKVSLTDKLYLCGGGFFGITVYFCLENTGVYMTSTSNAALIVASFPAIAAAIDFIFFRTRISWSQGAGILLALAGVCLLTRPESGGGGGSAGGNLVLLGAGFAWAFFNFLTRPVVNKYSGTTITYYQLLSGTLFFVPVVCWEGAEWHLPTAKALLSLLYLSVGCSLLAYLLYNLGLRKLPVFVCVSLLNLMPVGGVLLSWAVLGEQITLLQITGGCVVIVGVLLNSIRKPKPQVAVIKQEEPI